MEDIVIKKQQFDLEKKYHQAILKEDDENKRIKLYIEAYRAIYDFYKKYYPTKKSFGFIQRSLNIYKHLINGKVCVDYGCGTGISTIEMSKYAKFVYGIEVDDLVVAKDYKNNEKYKNIKFISNPSMDLPFENETIDFFYSTGVFEHLHPEDGLKHLKEVFRVLKSGGALVLCTPNKYYGPSDISKFFLR